MSSLAKIKYRANLLKFKLGVKKSPVKKTTVRIVVYHGLVKKDHLRFNNRFITVKQFEEHLDWYKKNANVISIDNVFENKLKEGKLNVAITFDDGYRNNFKYAVPLLEKKNIPAAFFITAIKPKHKILWPDLLDIVNEVRSEPIVFDNFNFIKKKNEFRDVETKKSLKQITKEKNIDFVKNVYEILNNDFNAFRNDKATEDFWKLMNKKEIEEISKNKLFTTGIHGRWHSDYTSVGIKESLAETKSAQKYLEKITGKKTNLLAYPFGSYDLWLVAALYKRGFKRQLVCDYKFRKNDSKNIVKNRFIINPFLSTKTQMQFLKAGKYF